MKPPRFPASLSYSRSAFRAFWARGPQTRPLHSTVFAAAPLLLVLPSADAADLPALNVRGYVGHFASSTGADLIVVDPSRFGQIVNRTTHALDTYSVYSY